MSVKEKDLGTYDKAEGEAEQHEFVQGFALSGEYVKNIEDKSFTIAGHRYEKIKDLNDETKTKDKLILTVALSDGTLIDYIPNKTSQQAIIAKCGYKLDKWIGFKGEFVTREQQVGKEIKNVIYIVEQNS